MKVEKERGEKEAPRYDGKIMDSFLLLSFSTIPVKRISLTDIQRFTSFVDFQSIYLGTS